MVFAPRLVIEHGQQMTVIRQVIEGKPLPLIRHKRANRK